MKNLLLVFLLVFANVVAYAQDIPANARTIVITFADSNTVNEKITKVLTGKDYTITPSKSPSLISTAAKTLKNNARVAFNVQIKGKEAFLTGKVVVAAQGNFTIEYKGQKGTPIMNGWEEMDKIAKAFGGKVRYEVK